MKPNMGQTDRIIRLVVGIVLLLSGLFAGVTGVLQVILILLGAILLATAAIRVCPLYMPFKFNTLKK